MFRCCRRISRRVASVGRLNRAAVILKYREPAVRGINEADPYNGSVLNVEMEIYPVTFSPFNNSSFSPLVQVLSPLLEYDTLL